MNPFLNIKNEIKKAIIWEQCNFSIIKKELEILESIAWKKVLKERIDCKNKSFLK